MPNPTALKEKAPEPRKGSGQAIKASKKSESSLSNATIPAKFLESCLKYPEKPALLYKKDHTFGYVQYKRLLNLVENFTLSLEKLGVKKGDRVIVISENRPEWAVADLSVKSLGAVLVPIHKVFSIKQIKSIVYEVEPALFIVSDTITLFKVQEAKKALKRKIPIVFLDITSKNDKAIASEGCDFISALKLLPHKNHGDNYKNRLRKLNASEIAAILYTPSSNGHYKGVQLTHINIVSNVENTKEAIEIREDDRFLSVLPLSHALEKTAGYYVPLFSGSTINYISDLHQFSKTVKEYKPTIIVGVPRLYEKTYKNTIDEISKSKLKKYFFDRAMKESKKSSLKPLNLLYEKLIYKKIREKMGGEVRFLVSGGAALEPQIGGFFDKAGIPVLEGYGLTESAPIVAVNRLENYRFGTVGFPLPNVNVKLADDEEILIKGPNITTGYFKKPKENNEHFNNGWFKTGDLGQFDDEGFLKIVGKKKEIIVLSTGKNVSPNAIESQLVKSKYIKQAFVVGDGKKHIAALIVPRFRALSKHFVVPLRHPEPKAKDLPKINPKEFIQNPAVKQFIQKEIDRLLENFAHYEQVRKFTLIEESFNIEDKTLTLQGKLFRQAVEKKYEQEIDKLYEESELFN